MLYNKRKGLTLAELLLALGLISIILLIGFNFFIMGNVNFDKQIDRVDNLSKARLAMRQLSTEIRKADSVEVDGEDKILRIDGVSYSHLSDSYILLKNEENYIYGIKSFNVIKEGSKISLELITTSRKDDEIKLSSTIYIRE